jgi:hypothetical protein
MSELPPLPAGYALDAVPPLPAGYSLDSGGADVSANNLARSAATGVPVIGGVLNKLDAATNAALAPVLNPLFDKKDQLSEPTFGERYHHSLRDQEGMDKSFESAHPILDTTAKLVGGVAATAPLMAAAPAAFGLEGTVPQMVAKGAASGAALNAADAVTRGENPVTAAETGGIIGGAAGPAGKLVGKAVSAIADRFRPPETVPQNVARVGNTDIPLTQSQTMGNPAASAEEQIIARGGRGESAQERAQSFNDLQGGKVNEARDTIAAGLDPSGKSSGLAPQDAAEKVASELIAQERASQAADAGVHSGMMSPEQNGADLARSFAGGKMQAPTAFDAGESLSDRLAAARDAAKADYRGKYAAVAQQPGEFAPGSAAGFRGDVENGLRSAENPVSLDATNTPKSLHALDVIDRHLNLAGPGEPKLAAVAADLGPQHAQNVADIRARFGDDVAAAYDRQKSAVSGASSAAEQPNLKIGANPQPSAPKVQSLLEFLASKGGLGPDSELEAIGAHNHTVNVDGVGRRKLVKQGGWPLDYAREAAEEAGYLRGDHSGTSTTNDLLDAMDAEMRGQKRYPEGFEGTETKREGAARSEREQHEHDQFTQGLEDELHAAGHGEIGPDVKQRAVRLMANEGMHPDTAVEHAIAQLDQEEAAGAGHGFPGDRAPSPKEAASAGSSFNMRDVEQVRKQLSTLYGDARRSMLSGGSGADLHALGHIQDQFDARVEQMVADGKFSGDGPAVLKMLKDARASFADYKQKFAKRGAGDTVGAAVEKILGKFSDTKATPDEVVKLAYGSGSSLGGQMPVQVAQRIAKIFGRKSEEFATYKQGLFHRLTEGEPAKVAERIGEFLSGTKGRLLAQTVFDKGERASLVKYADRLRSTLPREPEKGVGATLIRRIAEGNGTPNDIVSSLMGANGRGAGANSPLVASELKRRLSPEGWTQLRQMAFKKLTESGQGKIEFEAQALSQRMHEFLNEGGSQLAKVLYSPKELGLMKQLAGVYKQMIPVKGTTNPSGTAPMLAKIAKGTQHQLLPLLGFGHGGVPGAIVGMAADKGLTALSNAKAARKATELFYGPQAKRPTNPVYSKAARLIAQSALTQSNQR